MLLMAACIAWLRVCPVGRFCAHASAALGSLCDHCEATAENACDFRLAFVNWAAAAAAAAGSVAAQAPKTVRAAFSWSGIEFIAATAAVGSDSASGANT